MPSHSYDVLARLRPEVPASMLQRAANWTGDSVPSAPASAASVILLRDHQHGVETYLLHRHARMSFAASMVVFPGGLLDPSDAEGGLDPLRRCAVRETAEETGVLLREADLFVWARWITPEIEPRRYDTWFYVAAMPADQEAIDISGETDLAEWSTPHDALAAERSGLIKMLPPTISILIELADLPTVAKVINHATDRQIEPVLPQLVETESGWQFRYPQPNSRQTS
ncbi:MAG TPA: NUDIX hydrolase [Propionibacteriaceae bacterium]|nr:NUDIX hydrolase [Propionibacteriaceae bacterium]